MGIISRPNTYTPNTTISSTEANANENTIYNEFNGSIAAAVTATKIDWASTGADAGIWWEELGRTTLSGAGDTLTVSGFPARKYLRFNIAIINSGGLNISVRFNNDSGNNYSFRYLADNTGGTSVSQTSLASLPGTGSVFGYMDVMNISSVQKVGKLVGVLGPSSAASNVANADFWFNWVNTSAQITRIDFINSGAGDFAIGSEVVVLGHN
jgi:hypothetical protein